MRYSLCLVLLAACDAELASQQQGIVGGSPTTDYPASVAVMASNQTFRGQVYCSGTLIADRAVLTAAHCTPDPAYVMIGSDPEAAGARFVPVAETVRHPMYAEGTFEGVSHDVALLILAEDAPADVPRIPLATSVPAVGTAVTWVAFGHTSFDAGDKGIKRLAERTVTGVSGALVSTGNASCKADSGGSVYLDAGGHLELAGSDRGSVSMCTGDSTFIAASFNAAWITQTILDHGGGDPAADAAPLEPDAGLGDPGGDEGGGGCATGGAGGGGALGVLLALALLTRRRP